MTQPVAANPPLPTAQAQQPAKLPEKESEQSLRRFKALVERQPETGLGPAALPLASLPSEKRRSEALNLASIPLGEKAISSTAPTLPAPAASDQGDRIVELQKSMDLALGLDRAHARPTATQLILPVGDAVAGGTIAQGSARGAMDITLVSGPHGLAADALDALRRKLAARGLTVGQLRLVEGDDAPQSSGERSGARGVA